MKKIHLTPLIVILLFLGIANVNAQNHKSCCSPTASSTDEFAMLGNDKNFQLSHAAPVPFVFTPASGSEIQIKIKDGSTVNAFLVASAKPSTDYLFVFHEWWGLNDYIKKEAENLAEKLPNVNVLAIDLYHGKVARSADEAGKYMKEVTTEDATMIIEGAIAYAGPKARIQTLGWCFGGGWSLQAALIAGKQNIGCVMYYGMPEKDPKRLATLNGPVIGFFAEKDEWINKTVVGEFEKAMASVKKPLIVQWYKAVHAFANPSNPEHDKEATADAFNKALSFLQANYSK